MILKTRAFQSMSVAALATALSFGCKQEAPTAKEPVVRIDAERYRIDLFDDDQVMGGSQPLVTIVLFSDYACAPCKRTWQVMENLVEDYGEDLRVVWRSYTVPGFGRGEEAAEAALAAGAQGKFWDMHRRLYEHIGEFERPMLRSYAETIGIDVPKFLDDVDTGTYAGVRIRHRRQAKTFGVRGAPIAFANGLVIVGHHDESAWHALIDDEIGRARQMMQNGTPRPSLYAQMMAAAVVKPIATAAAAGEDDLRKELAQKQQTGAATRQLTTPDAGKRYRIEPGEGPARGHADAPVVIVEFLDFDCPKCRAAWHDELAGLLEQFDGDVKLAVRHLPLEIHEGAKDTARAAVAAARQGKFWEFHDRMIAHDGPVGRSVFVAIAGELGMDTGRFEKDLTDRSTLDVVDGDIRLAQKVGVPGTPGFFVNGRFVRGFTPGAITGVVREELAEADKLTRSGVPRREVFTHWMRDAVPETEFPNP